MLEIPITAKVVSLMLVGLTMMAGVVIPFSQYEVVENDFFYEIYETGKNQTVVIVINKYQDYDKAITDIEIYNKDGDPLTLNILIDETADHDIKNIINKWRDRISSQKKYDQTLEKLHKRVVKQ